jgi:hypothetical protein
MAKSVSLGQQENMPQRSNLELLLLPPREAVSGLNQLIEQGKRAGSHLLYNLLIP